MHNKITSHSAGEDTTPAPPTYVPGHHDTWWTYNCGWSQYRTVDSKVKCIRGPIGHMQFRRLQRSFPHPSKVSKNIAETAAFGRRSHSPDWRRFTIEDRQGCPTLYEHFFGDDLSDLGLCRILASDGLNCIIHSYGREDNFEVKFANLREVKPDRNLQRTLGNLKPKEPKAPKVPRTNLTAKQLASLSNLDDLL